jgi:hypothetical protein
MPGSKPKYVSRNIRKQWKEDMEKAIIAVRENKMGTEIILLYFCISYSFVHNLSPVNIYISLSFSFIIANFSGSPYLDPTYPRRLF